MDVFSQAILPEENGALWVSPAMLRIKAVVERVAQRAVPVLITGESGTGKEVVARHIHKLSGRTGPFVDVNCAALPRELIESELFGAVKGAYTGSLEARQGLFRKAEGGTILLDELAEMPIDTQSKLLRVLQEKVVRPVGGVTPHLVNARVLAATNRPPVAAITEGRLREDLFYRLSTIEIDLPPLRERHQEIIPLARLFLQRFQALYQMQGLHFSPEAEVVLALYPWPGNVRQLQSLVHRAAIMAEGPVIGPRYFPFALLSPEPEQAGQTERSRIVHALHKHGGNRRKAAAELSINRVTLFRKIKKYHIPI